MRIHTTLHVSSGEFRFDRLHDNRFHAHGKLPETQEYGFLTHMNDMRESPHRVEAHMIFGTFCQRPFAMGALNAGKLIRETLKDFRK